jgi:UDP-galactopyranose mutase
VTSPRRSLDVYREDVLFFSHLRWDFVFQRPQHIVSRFARDHRAWFWEEPIYDASEPCLTVEPRGAVRVVVPHLRPNEPVETLRGLLDEFVSDTGLVEPVGWYWTPMMRAFSDHVPFSAVIYDCMDELSHFAFAPPDLVQWETRLMADADVIFTGGHHLYSRKRDLHPNVHAFPSSVDVPHFAKAREGLPDPADQAHIPHPRIGWFGVIDERTDLALLDGVARARPDWQLVMIGPVVKISPETLPRHPNLHWLGMKAYDELPQYISSWDVAMLPFALNDATRFISPTKTPEYLAAGRPVVSTPITDVVRPYGESGLVYIADGVDEFVAALEQALQTDVDALRREADLMLSRMSWDSTVTQMRAEIHRARSSRGENVDAATASK